jgi:hypothetical protein
MGRAAIEFDDFDGLMVSPDLQATADRMEREGLDQQAILWRLAGEPDLHDRVDFAGPAWSPRPSLGRVRDNVSGMLPR